MSLRLRLVLLTLTLVALVAIALSALQLQTLVDLLSEDTIARARLAGDQTSSFLQETIKKQQANYPAAETPEQTGLTWTAIVGNDPDVYPFLLRTMSQLSESLLEINVADRAGQILVSTTPGISGMQLQRRELFSAWSQIPWYRRAYDLVTRRPDWEVSPRPIGIAQSGETVFQIQVVTSSLLLRQNLLDPLIELSTYFGIALAISLVLALLATHSALRPLQRIERTIDRITQGNFQIGEARGPEAKEFQAVESKLDILGQQVSGARSPDMVKNLDVLVESVATQLDVATRLSAISRLSSGVAHEIKNPLNAILLRLDLLKVRLGDSDEEVSQELEILSKEVLRLNRVVTTFLDFSRPVEVHFEDVDLAALAREVTELVRPQAAVAKIEVESDAGEPAAMRGDPDLLKQAILNLVTNAVEAMTQTGGKLRVTVARAAQNWILEVADTGPGIPPKLRDKVFQLYFTSKAKGSGIGLAMTYRAAQLHNGTITFSSESGAGTTFRLEFPATVTHA
jgi:signal transduction histidine kinase